MRVLICVVLLAVCLLAVASAQGPGRRGGRRGKGGRPGRGGPPPRRGGPPGVGGPAPRCKNVRCRPVFCRGAYTPARSCCPVCPGGTSKPRPRCAEVLCPPVFCDDAFTPRGRCCPVCPKPLPTYCDRVRCNRLWCDDTYTPRGQCCPVCKHPDPCANVVCTPVRCNDAFTPKGKCCPVCPPPAQCQYRGRVYQSGESWKVKCNRCSCLNGNVDCTHKSCVPKPGDCPVPSGYGACVKRCDDDDSCPGQMKCCDNGCGKDCMNPAPVDPCRGVRCQPLACSNTFQPQGECCPICLPGCQVDGFFYMEGDSVRTHDVCDECKCRFGNVRCEKKWCKPTHCDEPYTKPGDCCPECPNK